MNVDVSANPLLQAWAQISSGGLRWAGDGLTRGSRLAAEFTERHRLTEQFAFAVPSDEALDAIASVGPVVEVGAGTGYWAALLAARGVDVVAFDRVPAGARNDYGWGTGADKGGQVVGAYYPVAALPLDGLAAYRDRALFLCWPPMDATARDAVRAHGGDVVVYVGEGWGGCTADEAFFEMIEAEFEEVRCVRIPQWWGIHDWLWVYRRKAADAMGARRIKLEAGDAEI